MFMLRNINDIYNQTDVLFKNRTPGPSNPEWRNEDHKNHGLDITTLSNNEVTNNETNIRLFIARTGIELYSGTFLGKFNINEEH